MNTTVAYRTNLLLARLAISSKETAANMLVGCDAMLSRGVTRTARRRIERIIEVCNDVLARA